MRRPVKLQQFRPRDIDRVCKKLICTRAQLAARLGVSRACVCRWHKGVRAPQGSDAAHLRGWLGQSDAANIVDVFDLRGKLGMTQRVFGAQFGFARPGPRWKLRPRRNMLR